jgi:hypothetical protein
LHLVNLYKTEIRCQRAVHRRAKLTKNKPAAERVSRRREVEDLSDSPSYSIGL